MARIQARHTKTTTQGTEARQKAAGNEEGPAWLRPVWLALLLGILVAIGFPKALTGAATFAARDFGLFSLPVAHYQRECFWNGELPFWNPYNYCGLPFLAQWNTMCLYPPALIYLLLPLPWSLNSFCLLHLWFGGLGMCLLAQRWTANPLAAAVAGLVFAFNGLSLNLLMWPSHIATFSWMPWVVLAVEKAWRAGGRKLILAAVAAALQLLAGGPETILFTWMILFGLWGLEFLRGASPAPQTATSTRTTMAARLGLVLLLAVALAAVQLLPFVDLAVHSQRELGFADTAWSMPASGWANFVVPMAFGRVLPDKMFIQVGQQWTSSYYLGCGALLLALLAVWSCRDRRVWFLLGASLAALLCALGGHTFFYPALQKLIPQLTLMTYPVKFVIVFVFAAPLLAAFGVAWTQRARRESTAPVIRREWAAGGLLLGMVGIILLWAWRSPTPHSDFSATLGNGLSRAAFLVATILSLLGLHRARAAKGRGLAGAALLALLWLDVWTHLPQQNPTVARSVFTPGQARVELTLQPPPLLGLSRVMVSPAAKTNLNYLHLEDLETKQIAMRLGFFCDCNLLDDAPKVDGFFSLMPGRFTALFAALYFTPNARLPRLEDFLSVSHITAPGEMTQWETRPTWLPTVTAGQKPVFLDDRATAQRLLEPDFDSRKVVLLPPETEPLVAATRQSEATVSSLHFDRQQVDFAITASEPTLAVLSQTYYHWWRAYVDGQPAPLLQANYAFQAVSVPAGRHQVRLVYQDRTFQIGAIVSAVALLGCGLAWRRLSTPK